MSRRAPRRRGRATDASAPSADASTAAPTVDAATLLGLLGALPDTVAVGFEPTVEHLDVHVRPLPEDDRAAAAGLFTLVVPTRWAAVGAVVHGWAGPPDPAILSGADAGTISGRDAERRAEARARVVVLRTGEIASELCLDGVTTTALSDPDDPSPATTQVPEGLLVDSLHRMLELPCPGAPPALVTLVLGLWSGEVMRRAVDGHHVSWREAIGLHPGDPGASRVTPSVETLVEASVRAAHELDWGRMRRRAATGEFRPVDLEPAEADWMDDTMFGRWVLSAFPDPALVVEVLRATGSAETADGLEAVRLALPDV